MCSIELSSKQPKALFSPKKHIDETTKMIFSFLQLSNKRFSSIFSIFLAQYQCEIPSVSQGIVELLIGSDKH
jgi:hypothetical protein